MRTCLKQAGAASVAEAARLLRAGEVVGIPTETVYGLAANALSDEAVPKIFAAKGRPQDNPLISHIASLDMLPMVVREVPGAAYRLAEGVLARPADAHTAPQQNGGGLRVRRAGYGVCAYAQPSGGAGGHPRSGRAAGGSLGKPFRQPKPHNSGRRAGGYGGQDSFDPGRRRVQRGGGVYGDLSGRSTAGAAASGLYHQRAAGRCNGLCCGAFGRSAAQIERRGTRGFSRHEV